MRRERILRKIERLLHFGSATLAAFVIVLFAAACSNSTPEVRQNSASPTVASTGITISDLDAAAILTGTCQEVGRLDKGFEIQLDGSTWISKPTATCTNGRFQIRVEKLGVEMQFQNRVRATKEARVRRSSITGKTGETAVPVRYIPDTVSGGVANGGGVLKSNSGMFILRGSFQNNPKETETVATSTDAKFKMILSQDKDRL
jgi:hypothetical protein